MGVDCCITLPGNVRVRDVADVIAKCRGAQSTLEPFGWSDYHVRVDDVVVKPVGGSLAEYAVLCMTGPRHGPLWVLYHFASDGNTREILLRSTAANIAIAKRLVMFFGGEVDFRDSGDVDFAVAGKSDVENQPIDGTPWHDLQQRIHAITPITDEEIAEAVQFAAYE